MSNLNDQIQIILNTPIEEVTFEGDFSFQNKNYILNYLKKGLETRKHPIGSLSGIFGKISTESYTIFWALDPLRSDGFIHHPQSSSRIDQYKLLITEDEAMYDRLLHLNNS